METALDQIFYGKYSPYDSPIQERKKVLLTLDHLWRNTEKQIGKEAADDLRTQYEQMLIFDSLDDFRAGFRLGVSLMLEAFPQPGEK